MTHVSQYFDRRYSLNLSCTDRMGIVADVASFLAQQDCNILESAQFDDEISGQFFMRTVFGAGDATPVSYTHLTLPTIYSV